MEEENVHLRELLEERGWYKKWYTQVMGDILYPHVKRLAKPESNPLLSRFKEQDNNMLALYMAKEFMKNIGLKSTERIFEAEAGLEGIDQDFQNMIQSSYTLLKHSTPDAIQPPLLSQAIYFWDMADEIRNEDVPYSTYRGTTFELSGSLEAPEIIRSIMSDACDGDAEMNDHSTGYNSVPDYSEEYQSVNAGQPQYPDQGGNNSPQYGNRGLGNCRRCSK